MAEIPLTQGKVALVDDADLPLLSGYTWRAQKWTGGNGWYAITSLYVRGSGRRNRLVVPILMHGLLLHDAPRVDHRDGDGLNNRRENLRPCTQSQNLANRGKETKRICSSRYKGVGREPGRPWRASIRLDGRPRHLGYFTDEAAAARAYNAAALAHWGEYARLNVIEEATPCSATF